MELDCFLNGKSICTVILLLTHLSITTPGHQAYKVFIDDVNSQYQRIKKRTAEILAERAANPQSDQVEQIQLQAVEPGTEIHINVPQPNSEDEIERQARAVFESFPPGLQRALETGSLDRVNEVLAKMSVEEAEEVVGQLGESGMLDMKEGVIDSTTEEGQQQLKEIEKERLHGATVEGTPDPGLEDP
jgi:cell division cycle protein 37